MQWVFPPPGLQSSITLPAARKRVTGFWGVPLAHVFHSRQWSKYCPPFMLMVLLSGGGDWQSCQAQKQPTGDGVLPHGSPRRWGILVPHCIEVSPLPGCRAIAQGCQPLKKKTVVGKMSTWFCTPGCKIEPFPSLDTSARPQGSPGLGQMPSGLVCPRGEVTMMSPTPRPDNLQETCADIEERRMTRGTHWTVSL